MSAFQITVKSIQHSPSINYHVKKYFDKLREVFPNISHCHVTIDTHKNRSIKERLFKVNADVTIPGIGPINSHKSDEQLFLAIRMCFQVVERLARKSINSKKKSRKKYYINKNSSMRDHAHSANM